ncbi:hypothetical protein ACWENQ_44350 [Nonomuraea sp. NPDC004354]
MTRPAPVSAGNGTHPLSRLGQMGRALAARWPAWFALAFAAVNLADLKDGRELAVVVLLSAMVYQACALAGRRGVAWPALGVLVAVLFGFGVLDGDPWPVLVGTALVLAVGSLLAGRFRGAPPAGWQVPAMLAFGALAVTAEYVVPGSAGYLVAGALIAHAVWDWHHWRANAVVSRSLAEWCGVLDLTLGVGILILL